MIRALRPLVVPWLAAGVLLSAALPSYGAPQYMEVWPFVLTDGMFHIHIPNPEAAAPDVTVDVKILSAEGQLLRQETTTAPWENLAWPDEAWEKAGLATGQAHRGAWIARVPIAPTAPGSYTFKVEITAPEQLAGRAYACGEVALHPRPEWLDTRAGIEGLDVLPRPWSPVTSDSRDEAVVLSCWNRTMALSDGGLVDSIRSGETELLAGPMEVLISDAQGHSAQPVGAWHVEPHSETQATVSRALQSPDTSVQVKLSQEYDGLTWMTLDVDSKPGVSHLELRVPIDRSVAQYIYYFPDLPWYFGNVNNVQKTPRPGYGWTSGHCEWLYLGSLSEGLVFYCGSRSKYQAPHEADTIQVVTDGEAAELRVRVLKGHEPVHKEHYEFAIQATPVKPWPEDPLHNRVTTFMWRAANLLSPYTALGEPYAGMKLIDRCRQAGIKVIHLCEWWTTAWGGTEPREPESLKQLVQEAHERGMAVIVYFGFEIDDSVQAFKNHPWEMLGGDPRLRHYVERRYYGPARYDRAKPSRKTYGSDRSGPEMERILAGMEKLLIDYDIDGFYLDGTQLPTGSLRRARELMKRMRYLVDTHSTRGIIYAHTSSRNNIAVNAFGDVVYNGEQLRAIRELKSRDSIVGAIPTDYTLLLMNGTPWGVPHDLCEGQPAFADLAQVLNVGVNTYQWREDYWPLQKVWVEADLWHAAYTPPQEIAPRWKDCPSGVFASHFLSGDKLHTVLVYNGQSGALELDLPARQVLGLDENATVGMPRVAFCREKLTWQAREDTWHGIVPAGQMVILQMQEQ